MDCLLEEPPLLTGLNIMKPMGKEPATGFGTALPILTASEPMICQSFENMPHKQFHELQKKAIAAAIRTVCAVCAACTIQHVQSFNMYINVMCCTVCIECTAGIVCRKCTAGTVRRECTVRTICTMCTVCTKHLVRLNQRELAVHTAGEHWLFIQLSRTHLCYKQFNQQILAVEASSG